MALIGANHGFVNTYFGCNGKFNGVLEMWQGVDLYMQKVDQGLCSSACPCLISNPNQWGTNTTVAPYYSRYNASNNFGSIAFQNCSTALQYNTYASAVQQEPLFDPKKNFDTERFARYMSNVEREFQCTGWCNVTYYDASLRQNMVMYKYLFSDVNR